MIVLILMTRFQDYTVFIFSGQEENSELEECIFQTKRINWPLGPSFISVESQHFPVVKKFMSEHMLESSWERFNLYMWLPQEEAKEFEYE